MATLSADDLREICAAMAVPDDPVTPTTSPSASPVPSLTYPYPTISEDGGDPGGGGGDVGAAAGDAGDGGLAVEDIGVGVEARMAAGSGGGSKTGSPSSFF